MASQKDERVTRYGSQLFNYLKIGHGGSNGQPRIALVDHDSRAVAGAEPHTPHDPYRRTNDYRGESHGIEVPSAQNTAYLRYNLGGPVQICRFNGHKSQLVARRELSGNRRRRNQLQKIKIARDKHIVGIESIVFEGDTIIVTRSYMYDITLRTMCGVLPKPLGSADIAVISRSVIAGLSYVHEHLQVPHLGLSGDTVLISLFGAIRVCNIEDAVLANPALDERNSLSDSDALHSMLLELLEPKTWCESPDSQNLKYNANWRETDDIVRFWGDIKGSRIEELKHKHPFVHSASESACFEPYVLMGLMMGLNNVATCNQSVREEDWT